MSNEIKKSSPSVVRVFIGNGNTEIILKNLDLDRDEIVDLIKGEVTIARRDLRTGTRIIESGNVSVLTIDGDESKPAEDSPAEEIPQFTAGASDVGGTSVLAEFKLIPGIGVKCSLYPATNTLFFPCVILPRLGDMLKKTECSKRRGEVLALPSPEFSIRRSSKNQNSPLGVLLHFPASVTWFVLTDWHFSEISRLAELVEMDKKRG